jgi:hypothetical protein
MRARFPSAVLSGDESVMKHGSSHPHEISVTCLIALAEPGYSMMLMPCIHHTVHRRHRMKIPNSGCHPDSGRGRPTRRNRPRRAFVKKRTRARVTGIKSAGMVLVSIIGDFVTPHHEWKSEGGCRRAVSSRRNHPDFLLKQPTSRRVRRPRLA